MTARRFGLPSGAQSARIESSIGSAFGYVTRAALESEALRDQGLADDLHQIATELRRLQEDLLRRGRLRTRP